MDSIEKLSKLALVASDQSYDPSSQIGAYLSQFLDSGAADVFPNTMPDSFKHPTDVGLEQWRVFDRIDDSDTGFGATIYERANIIGGKVDFMVALQGTRGPSPQDWNGNAGFALDKWKSGDGGQLLLRRLSDLLTGDNNALKNPSREKITGDIYFTGQSLGGALAEYAAYDFRREVDRLRESEAITGFSNDRIALVTFNGLGGIAGLQQLTADRGETFDSGALAGSTTRHYWIPGDLVHRLGEGTGSLAGQVHLNGQGKGYRLDFFARHEDGKPDSIGGKPRWNNLIDAHRLEMGFYAGINEFDTGFTFSGAQQEDVTPLHITGLATTATAFSNLYNSVDSARDGEATARIVATLLYGIAFGDEDEIKVLIDALGESMYRSGLISEKKFGFIQKSLPGILSDFSRSTAGVNLQMRSLILGSVLDSFEQSNTVSQQTRDMIAQGSDLYNDTTRYPSNPILNEIRALTLATLDRSVGKPDEKVRVAYEIGRKLVADSVSDPALYWEVRQITQQHLDELIPLLFEDNGLKAFVAKLVFLSVTAHVDVAVSTGQLIGYLQSLLKGVTKVFGVSASTLGDYASEAIEISSEIAKALANAVPDFTEDYADAQITFGEFQSATQQRSAVDAFVSGLTLFAEAAIAVLTGSRDARGVEAVQTLNQVRRIATAAAETVVIRPSHSANPFDALSFDPDASPVAVSELKEGSASVFTAYLPYEPGEGGQRIKLALAGVDLDRLTVLADGSPVAMTDGEFELTVAQGRKQVSFALVAANDLGQSGTVSVSATLVDANGVATHRTHLEANLQLEHEVVSFDQVYNATEDSEFLFNGSLLPGRARAQLNGGARSEIISGDHTSEQINAGEGNNFIIESPYRVYSGSASDPFKGGDTISAGAGNDFITGELGAVINTGDGDNFVQANYAVGMKAIRINEDGSETPFIGLPLGVFSDVASALALNDVGSDPAVAPDGSLDFRFQLGFGNQTISGIPRFSGENQTSFTLTPNGNGTANLRYFGADQPVRYRVELERGVDLNNGADVQIRAGSGNDHLFGAGGADFILGGAGNDRVAGGAGDDTLEGGEGNDQIIAGAGDDFAQGGADEDRLWGEAGNDELDGGEGNDVLIGDSDTTALARQGDDYLDGGAGNDALYGNGGNDELFGGEGNDYLDGSLGNDYLDGEAGDDYLTSGSGDDTLFGGAGTDNLSGGEGNDYLDGEDGTDFLDGGEGEDTLWGGAGADGLTAGGGNDELHGEDGDDALDGGTGNDLLEGGTGNDTLFGGAGDDTYLLDIGDGADLIVDSEGANSLRFGDGVALDTIRVLKGANPDAGNLTVYYGSSDAILISAGQYGTIQSLRFADGSSLNATQLADLVQSGSRGASVRGGAFGDELQAADTDSTLDGQGGDDVLIGGPGNDTLIGGDGNDVAYGMGGDDILEGDAGSDFLDGGDGNDTLIGGAGTNALVGGAGDDTYVFNLDGSANTITDTEGASGIQFGAGIDPSAVTIQTVFDPFGQRMLQLQYSAADTITFSPEAAIQSFAFADGRVLSRRELFSQALLDQVVLGGTDDADELDGGANSDFLYGYGGDDVLKGGALDDRLDGGAGNDLLVGGLDNDTLIGGSGSDTYFFARGDGQDVIVETERDAGDVNTLQFAPGILQQDVAFTHLANGDLLATIGGTDESITVRDWYNNPNARLDRVVFGDGSEIAGSVLTQLQLPAIVGTAGDDYLSGTAKDDVIEGLEGNDVLNGGQGADLLQGGEGDDTYALTLGQGRDTIVEADGQGSVLQLPALLDFSELQGAREGNDLFVHVRGAGDGFVLKDYYTLSQQQWTLRSADGTTKPLADWLLESSQDNSSAIVRAREDFVTQVKLSYAALASANGFVPGQGGTFDQLLVVFAQLTTRDTMELRDGGVRLWRHSAATGESSFQFGLHAMSEFSLVNQASDAPEIFRSDIGTPETRQFNFVGESLQDIALDWERTGFNSTSGINIGEAYRSSTSTYAGTAWGVTPADNISVEVSQAWQYLADTGVLPGHVQAYLPNFLSRTSLETIQAGPSDNAIHLGDFDLSVSPLISSFNPSIVDAGPGNDVIYGEVQRGGGFGENDAFDMGLPDVELLGDFLDGGDGNDTIYGSVAADVLVGGNGDNYLDGRGGADTYLFLADEQGDNLVFDEGSAIDYGGRFYSWTAANDFRALEPSYGNAIHPDTVQFGAGISASDLQFSWGAAALYGQTYETLNLSWGAGKGARIVLPHPEENDGAGIEYFKFADGTRLTMADMVARAPAPDSLDALGTQGDDQISGGAGNDRVLGYWGDDVICGNGGDDTIFGGKRNVPNVFVSSPDFTSSGNDALYGGDGSDFLDAEDDNNVVDGGAGADYVAGTHGRNFLAGGTGDDVLDAGDRLNVIGFNRGDGRDVVQRFGRGTISMGNVAPATLSLSRESQDLLIHTGGDDVLRLSGWYDTDPADRGDVNLQLIVDDIRLYDLKSIVGQFDLLQAQDPSLTSWAPGAALADAQLASSTNRAIGGDIAYQYAKFGRTDTLSADVTRNALRNDNWAVDSQEIASLATNASPIVANPVSDQTATEDSLFSFTLPADTFSDPDAGDTLAYSATLADGSNLPTWLSFDAATRTFSGTPDDPDVGALALKVTATDSGGLSATSLFTLTVADANEVIIGTNGRDTLIGGPGDDRLDGGLGIDTMIGGAGNDTYVVNKTADVVVENSDEGTDIVLASATYTLSANVENLVLTGASGIRGTGNGLDNVLTGNSAANVLDGGAGSDTMIGGLGNDSYVVEDANDVVIESPAEGTDVVKTSVDYALPDNVENLTLTGTAAISGVGNALNNVMTANAAASFLSGGAGNDTYVVDYAGVSILENASEGTDLVKASVSFALADNVENLTLTGTGAIDGTGNALNNVLTGNAAANVLSGGDGNDTLKGGGGVDTLIGGTGNDIYVIDNPGDAIVENVNEGTDIVKASMSYALADNLENLTLTGTEAINGTGNALNNVLTGNDAVNVLAGGDGNDTLNGGGGADTLIGGTGNDVYVVADADITIVENPGEGTDTVKSSLDCVLGDNLENLTLTGSANLNGFGNALDNVIAGNSGANLLEGLAGNDTLSGNLANDVLQGGAGSDTLRDNGGSNLLDGGASNDSLVGNAGNEMFVGGSGNDTVNTGAGADIIAFNRGDGQDTAAASQGADNTLSLGGGIGYQDLAFKKSGSNLVLQLGMNPQTGVSEQISFSGWYSTTADNKSVTRLQMNAEAMAGFDPNSSDPLLNKKIQTFDFQGLATAFDVARAANPKLTSWALSNALGANHAGGSDTEAIGGDLAYAYGRNGTLAGVGLDTAQAVLGAAGFGAQAQAITQVYEGGAGSDHLHASSANSLLSGGAGDDNLAGDDGNDFLAGDAGNDTINTGTGANIIAFNAGGGTDIVQSASGAANTLSLGNGISYDDLSLAKDGNDLIVNAGADDHLVFKDWYGGKDNVVRLQVILDASAAFDANASDPLYNKKVQSFDFRGLANTFDEARAQSPGLSSWAMTNALLQFHLSGSDDAALGGDLAYWYGKNGTLGGVSLQAAQQTIGAPGFGSDAQTLRPFSGLEEGLVRLS